MMANESVRADERLVVEHPPTDPIPAYYACLYASMVQTARDCGYALCLHGSMQRDLDLVAIAWTDEAIPAQGLVDRLMEQHRLVQSISFVQGAPKPHGRVATVLMLSGHYYIDLSIMPPRSTP